MTNICSAIACPFWSDDHRKSYGCQRYRVADLCHLKHVHPELESNEYALSTRGAAPEGLKQENDRFFLEDPHYQQLLEFWDENPECRGHGFEPRDIRGDRKSLEE